MTDPATTATPTPNVLDAEKGWGPVQVVSVMPVALSAIGFTLAKSLPITGTFAIRGIKIQTDKPTGTSFCRFGYTSQALVVAADMQAGVSLILPQSVFQNSNSTVPAIPLLFGNMDLDDFNFQVLQPGTSLWACLELASLPTVTNMCVTFVIELTS